MYYFYGIYIRSYIYIHTYIYVSIKEKESRNSETSMYLFEYHPHQ